MLLLSLLGLSVGHMRPDSPFMGGMRGWNGFVAPWRKEVLRITGRFISRLSNEWNNRRRLTVSKVIHSLATSAYTRQYTRWYRLLHLKPITVSSYLYNNRMRAKLANALSRER